MRRIKDKNTRKKQNEIMPVSEQDEKGGPIDLYELLLNFSISGVGSRFALYWV